jgi:hypothetical protein
MMSRRVASLASLALLLAALSCRVVQPGRVALPGSLDDEAFWRFYTELSEPGGTFRSDNLLSNERAYPSVLPDVARRRSPNAAYVGVGPEQNFSYLAALRPRMAFIVDVRRENSTLHLLYKAIFELSPTRADFLSRLFSRPLSKHLNASSTASDLMEAAAIGKPDRGSFTSNLEQVRRQLVEHHRWALDPADMAVLTRVYEAFFEAGPGIQYSVRSFRRGPGFPSYAELMTAGDVRNGSFLATEENYQAIRDLQLRNLVLPVVGDFSGSKALVGVGGFLRGRGLTVAVFYASNVEMYLFRGDAWKAFYKNLSSLPIDGSSIVVRSVFQGFGRGFFGGGFGPPGGVPPGSVTGGPPGELWADGIESLLADVKGGAVASYGDLLARIR